MCRPYIGLAFQVGTGLAPGAHVATVTEFNSGAVRATWNFTITP
jgi:hypothetical protein